MTSSIKYTVTANATEPSPSCEADAASTIERILRIYATGRCIHLSLSWARRVQFLPYFPHILFNIAVLYTRGADKSLARPGRKQARKHVRDARDFNNIEKWAVIKLFLLLGKAPKEIHAVLTETLACFLPGRAKDLPAPLCASGSWTLFFGLRSPRSELHAACVLV